MKQDKAQGTARILNAIAAKQFVLADRYLLSGDFEKSRLMNRLALRAKVRANELKGEK